MRAVKNKIALSALFRTNLQPHGEEDGLAEKQRQLGRARKLLPLSLVGQMSFFSLYKHRSYIITTAFSLGLVSVPKWNFFP